MWIKDVMLAILGLSAGITAAGGLFSFIIGLGVVSDFADRTHTGEHVMLYEDTIAVGGSIGAVISIYPITMPQELVKYLIPVVGLFSGIFVGCWAMALTEIVDAVPVFSRRIRLKTGMPWLILSMALGRAAGAWMHAYFGYGW